MSRSRKHAGSMNAAPRVGQAGSTALGGDGFILVRHAETAVVDDALQRIADGVQVTLGA